MLFSNGVYFVRASCRMGMSFFALSPLFVLLINGQAHMGRDVRKPVFGGC